MRKQLAVAATAAMLTALLPLGSSALADGQGPQIIAGTLVDGNGSPVAADITVSVESAVSGGDMLTPIAHGASDQSGVFDIHGALGNAPATVNPDGSVTLEVDAVANGNTRLFYIDATPPDAQSGRPDWTWGDVVDPNMLPTQAAAAGLPSQADAQAQEHSPLGGLQLDTGDTLAAQPNTMTTASSTSCDAGLNAHIVWLDNGNTTRRNAPIMHFTVKRRMGINYDWATTKESKSGIAVNWAGSDYGGGLSYEQTQTTDHSLHASHDSAWNGWLKINVQYNQQYRWCQYIDPYGVMRRYRMDGDNVNRWVPDHWTLGTAQPTDSLVYNCGSGDAVYIATDVTTGSGDTKVYNNTFTVANVKLDASQTTSTNHQETAVLDRGYAKAHICGSGSDPSYSSLFWEIPM